jgi:RNA polymerase sigma-70 factor (ECF subfamily)
VTTEIRRPEGGTVTRELVELAMRGDREAFGVLASRSLPRLVGAAGLILGSHDPAEDAAQDALVRAWRDLPSLKDPDRFDAWLYRVLVRACHDQLRRAAREGAGSPRRIESHDTVPDHATTLGDRDAIESGLRRLTVEQRTVLVLRFYLDLSHAEIAAAVQLPVGTVKSRLSRALSSLHAALAADDRAGVAGERPA